MGELLSPDVSFVRVGSIRRQHCFGHSRGRTIMKDYQASVQKLRTDAAEAALIRDLATDPTKREMFSRLHEHLSRLADEVERAMSNGGGADVSAPPTQMPSLE